MKQILRASVALLIATAAWGQHGGGGHVGGGSIGGGSAHISSGFSSGRSFSAPTAPQVFGAPSANRPSSQSSLQGHKTSYQWSPAPIGGSYPYNGRDGNHGRNPGNGRGRGYRPYYYSQGVYAVPGWLNYGYYGGGSGYSDDYSDEPQGAADAGSQQAAAQGYDPNNGEQEPYPPQPYPPARPAYQAAAVSEPASDQPEVTLLFKDGRTPQQVTNYAVTQTTLYVLDGARRREIPLDQIDLPQTEKTNRAAGVDFEVPVAAE
jgi:hypothetical protein